MFSIHYEITVPHVEHIILPDRIRRVVRNSKNRILLLEGLTEKSLFQYLYSIDPMFYHEYYIEGVDTFIRADEWVNRELQK